MRGKYCAITAVSSRQTIFKKYSKEFKGLSRTDSVVRVCRCVCIYIYKPPVCKMESFQSQPDERSCSVPIASLAVTIATFPLTAKVF